MIKQLATMQHKNRELRDLREDVNLCPLYLKRSGTRPEPPEDRTSLGKGSAC
jgi:hypothetical protein